VLILTRKLGEGIIIGTEVVVRVVDIKGGQVKLGIDAPHATSVHREEVHRRICQENLRAAAHAPRSLDDIMRARPPDGEDPPGPEEDGEAP
jgi:carbon storage regulator